MKSSNNFMLLCGAGRMNHLAQGIIKVINQLRRGQPTLNLADIDFSRFSEGEPDDNIVDYEHICGRHVVFFASTHGDLVLPTLEFCWAIKRQYGATSLTVVMPYMAYRRQDHPEKQGEIHRNLCFSNLLACAGVDHIIVCDPHSKQMGINAESVGIRFHVVDPTAEYVARLLPIIEEAREEHRKFFIYAPDMGSIERAATLARMLDVPVALNLKQRTKTGQIKVRVKPSQDDRRKIVTMAKKYDISVMLANHNLKGADVCIREDELATANTLRKNADILQEIFGVRGVYVCVTHPVCVDVRNWKRNIGVNKDTPFEIIFCGNTIFLGYEHNTGDIIWPVDLSNVIGRKLHRVMESL
jgi:ribose-phosphate pyrophosphokinase